jgi:predicted PurR-regulated permease PerM
MLYVGQGLIVPLIFGAIIAIVLHPVVKLFVRWKFNRLLAIIVTILLSFLLLATFGLFLITQLSRFSESWPVFVDKFTNLINQTIHWIPVYFDISALKVNKWIAETKTDLLDGSGLAIGQTLLSVGSGIVVVFLIPVYIFLFLYYKPLLLDFIHKLFADNRQVKVSLVISQTKTVIQSYLTGLFIEIALVAMLDTVGLLMLGIEYAVVIGILGALLNLIPYIGGLVAVAIPMMIALVTKDSAWFALYVLILYYVVQLIDNNYFVPKIVASKVRINALVSIFSVLAGGTLWGISGMFLSIPLIAIVKVICDQIEPLKPLGLLLGDTMPVIGVFKVKKV